MIGFTSSFIEFILATFVPLYFGMVFVVVLRNVARIGIRYLSAFAFGLLLWFFLDTLNDAIQLGVNDGYTFGPRHAALLLLFILGFLALALPSGIALKQDQIAGAEDVSTFYASPAAILVALGMGFHGVSEGLGIGALSAGTSANTLVDAIGGYGGATAYILHKLLEAAIVMSVYVAMARGEGRSLRKQLWNIAMLGLLFGTPSAVGEIVGYYVPIDSSYFYALGSGAALFVALLIVKPIFSYNGKQEMTYSQWVGIVLALLLGFLSLYGAAAFHSG